ncbi:type II secretion system F family protein [Lentzea sp. CA-135723]|uniref:type II secretion system F family protein n=1 Tax=Lentzea sp. CA-135723 TaxID=3239950 RepID=UPI003D8F8D2A
MTITTLLFALLAAGAATGVILIVIGLRGQPEADGRTATSVKYFDQKVAGRLAVALLVGVGVGMFTGWVVGAVLTAAAVLGLPRILASNADHQQQLERIEAIASWTEMLRDTLMAAAGLEQAIIATASTCPEPVRGEITALAVRLERGERLAPCLRELAEQLHDPTADLVISALVLASDHQARQLADLLGELAVEAREQATMRMRVDAGRARSRTSVRVIVVTTLAFAAGLVLFNRDYLRPFDSPAGQLALLLVGALFATAFAWMAKISRFREPDRFLTELDSIRAPESVVDEKAGGKGATT